MRIDGHLRDRLALRAGPLAADMALDGEHAGFVVELLCDVFADALQLAAASASGVTWIVVNDLAWKLCRQWLALGLRLGCWGRWRRLKLCNLFADGRQIGLDLVVEQAALLRVVVLGLGRELHALEQRILVCELGSNRFAVLELRLTDLQITEQARGHGTQLLLAQTAQIIQGLRHQLHALQCAIAKRCSACADSRIAKTSNCMNCCTSTSQNRDRTSSAYTLPWQAQHQCLQLLRLQRPMRSARSSPDELAPMQTACCQPHTNAVMHQHLHARGAPVGKHIGMMRLGRAEDGNHPGERRVHACTHVQWIGGKPGGIDADHAGAPLNKDCSQCLHSAAAATGQCTDTCVP